MRTIYSAMIYRQYERTGSPDAGYDWLKKLDANTAVYTPTPDDMYLKLDRGVGTVTLWNLQDALIQPMKNNRPWSFVIPTSGVPVLLDGVGIVNNPKTTQAATDFENFLLEPQLQAQLAKDYYQIPALQLPDCRQTRVARQTRNQRNEDRLDLDESKANRVDELLVPKHQG